MQTNDQCSGPCFWGISPGVTGFDQAVDFLRTLKATQLEENKYGTLTYNDCFLYKGEKIAICLIFSGTNDRIPSLWAKVVGLQYLNITGKDWLAFRPDNFLKTYGPPVHILITMAQGQEGLVVYGMIFLYDQMYIQYNGSQAIFLPNQILHACPIVNHNISQFTLVLGKYDEQDLKGWVDLTQMSSITVDRFYKILTGDPDLACFNLDYQKFLDEYKK